MWNDLMSFVQRCHARIHTFELKREEGQGLVEYSLLLGLITVGAIVALTTIGKDVSTFLNEVVKTLEAA